MENMKKNFGFGCMRLPMKDNGVDYVEFSAMIDTFMDNGFNYFDTAHGYIGGKSEIALRDCLTKRYSRDQYILTNKLSTHFFEKQEQIRPLFESQLEACGVDYFDIYLMRIMMVLSGMSPYGLFHGRRSCSRMAWYCYVHSVFLPSSF